MSELGYLVLGQFVVSALMGLAAVCVFLWAVSTGLFRDIEQVKHQVLRSESADEER